jgi:hypothetical protein
MAMFKVQLFSYAIGLSLIAGTLPATCEEMPLPPSVAQDMATGASPGPATAAKTKATKRGKRGAKAAKTKVQGGVETDKSAEENMNTGAETPSATPTLTPSGGAGLNFRF